MCEYCEKTINNKKILDIDNRKIGNYSCCRNNSIDIIYDVMKANLIVKE